MRQILRSYARSLHDPAFYFLNFIVGLGVMVVTAISLREKGGDVSVMLWGIMLGLILGISFCGFVITGLKAPK